MSKIFISHSSANKDFVRELSIDLKESGHEPWLDEWEIKVGECIVTKIEEAISSSNYVIIVLSPESVNSGWVEREWKTAYWSEIESNKIIVLPVLFKDCEIPSLLKTKKYADFRKRYSIGFSQLIQSIIPSDIENDVNALNKSSINEKDISSLLSKIHSRQIPLSQAIAESIPIASKYNNIELLEFCKSELSGWNSTDDDKDLKASHRLSEMYCSFVKINTNHPGWNANSSNIFNFMDENTEKFFPHKMFLSEPISSLEQKATYDTTSTFISWVQPITDIIDKPSNPDAKVYCYARADSFKKVLEAVRTELTKLLLNMLPGVK